MGFAHRTLRIRPDELRPTVVVGAAMFVALSTAAIAESGINALFLARLGVDALPLMYLVQAAATLAAMVTLTAILGRVSQRRFYIASPLVLAVVVLAQRVVLFTGVGWIYPVMWMTVAFATLAQGIGLWGTAGAVVDARQAKRLFPIFGACGIFGSVIGGLVTRPLASALGAENLLLAWVAGLVVASLLGRMALHRSARTVPPAAGRHRSLVRDAVDGIALVRRSRLVGSMAAAAALFSVLFYSLFLPFADAATERFPDADALAGFFGSVWATIAGTAFLVSMLFANRLFVRFGIASMILVLPLLYAGSFGVLLTRPGFATIVSLRIVTGVWLQGVASPAWEAIINVVPDDRRDRIRTFLNGGPTQVGTAIAGVVALLGQEIASDRQLAATGLAASLLTLVVALSLRRSYADALLDGLRAGRPQVFERPSAWTPIALKVDARAIQLLSRSMRSDDVHVRRLAFELVDELTTDALAEQVVDGLTDADAAVRLAAIRALDDSTPSARAALMEMIEDTDAAVAAAASARAIAMTESGTAAARLDRLLRHDDVDVRRSAIEQLGLAGPAAAELADPLLDDPDPRIRAAAIEIVAQTSPDRGLRAALGRLRDEDHVVRVAAGRAAAAGGERAVDAVLSALGDPRATDAAIEAARRLRADGAADRVRVFVASGIDRATRDRDLVARIPVDGEAEALLRDALLERGRHIARSALWATTMLGRNRDAMQTAIECLDGPPPLVANALETLDVAGDPALVRPLIALWEPVARAGSTEDTWLPMALADADSLVRRCAELVRARREGIPMPHSSMTTISVIERVLLLRRVPLFADLPPNDLERVARIAEEQGYTDGEVLARQGEPGHELHLVLAGTIRVVQELDGRERDVARRTVGDVVGEMAIISQGPRIASLVADGVVRTIRIGHREFESMLRDRPNVALAVMRVLASRIAEATRFSDADP